MALAGDRPPSNEERKVVTVLFADLVRSTSPAERMDPEDVRALLSPFYGRLRAELERFGGTVEKFIVLAAEILGRRAEMRRWLGTQLDSPWFVVTRALADREFVAAAEALDSMGAARSAALARLLAAEQLASTGRRQEADDQLRPALGFFRSVGAMRFSHQAEALLAASA